MRWLVLTLAVVSTARPAIAEPARPATFKEVRRTSRVTYYAPKGSSVDVKRTEAFLDRLFALFGPGPDGWRLEYYRHDSASIVHADLGASAYGVTDLDRLRIDSVRDYHPHELVHAVAARFGRPPLVFAEGLAVALTSEGKWRGSDLDQAALRALTAGHGFEPFLGRFTEQDPDAAYAVAGSLVSYLLDRYGIEPFNEFLRGCGFEGARFETSFRRAYGRTLARATIEWEQALRQGPHAIPEWYDAASWPRSLQRERATAVADDASTPVNGGAQDGGARGPRALADLGRVLDPGPSPVAPSSAPNASSE